MSKLNIHKLFLLLGCSFFFVSPVWAGMFWPSNEDECIQKYVVKTHANKAAMIIGGACRDLFKEEDFDSFLDRPDFEGYSRRHVLKAAEQLDPDKPIITLESLSVEFKKERAEKIKKAKCLLALDKLYDAQNDQAAMMIYQTSSCMN